MSKKSLKSLATFLGSGGHIFEGSLFQGPNQGSTNHGQLVSIDKLQVGRYQPRTNIDQDYLSELEDSIRGLGIIQPLIVRPIPSQEGQYEIIVGEMRFRAAQKAGLTEVPVIIRDADDRLAAIIALVENLQRKDLNPIEQAQGINRLMDEFGLTQKEVAKVLGFKNQSTVSKSLGLLKLDPQVQAMILEGRLDAGHAKVLLSMDPTTQVSLARKADDNDWSVRELERRKTMACGPSARKMELRDPDLDHIERRISERLGGKRVRLHYSHGSGRGKIEIRFNGLDDCRKLIDRLGLY